jgi:crotonobetainyl-CoA:carnitine CoA-transferase CaiB-like acyl-CoA transferase
MVVSYDHPAFGKVRSTASPVKVGDEPSTVRRGPRRNENAAEILHDLLGYDAATIDNLAAAGAFGQKETEIPLKAR